MVYLHSLLVGLSLASCIFTLFGLKLTHKLFRNLETKKEKLWLLLYLTKLIIVRGLTVHTLILTLVVTAIVDNSRTSQNFLINFLCIMPSGYILAYIRQINEKLIKKDLNL